jgi:hypothetical protein
MRAVGCKQVVNLNCCCWGIESDTAVSSFHHYENDCVSRGCFQVVDFLDASSEWYPRGCLKGQRRINASRSIALNRGK